MSLSAALNTSVTGLATIQTQLSVISGNVANAENANYTRKTVTLTTPTAGGQPQAALVSSVVRATAPYLQADYYTATASYQQLITAADNARTLAEALDATSTTGDQSTLEALMTDYEDALKQLEATPEDTALKALVVQRGQSLATEINRLAGLRSQLQSQAQQDIQNGLSGLNEASDNIAKLNAQIVSQKAAGYPTGDLEDLRDAEVAKIAELVGVRTVVSDTGVMTVYSDTGTMLAGSSAQTFSYDSTAGTITNASGVDVTAGFRTGSLRAELDYLDDSATALASSDGNVGTLAKFFNQLDSLAQNIADVVNAAYDDPATAAVEQFFTYTAADPAGTLAVDATLVATPTNVNAERAGTVQQAMRSTTLTAAQVNPAADPNGLQVSSVTIFGLASGILSYHAELTSENETNRDTAESLQYTLDQKIRNLTGVDIDTELAQLQTLQTNYAALAQIMNAITEMFDQMISIGS
ncbi:flagellar hook-associated protein FlgK [Ferrovibrio sp.]|uniref:flagellar hook-associated protein FlgK n=1 Tax=Ferrovibrio sp. TaxID=1917215 RepID=UPI002628F6E3|nr:flagellar hook-associated protein FlgK [Ferrovibrio sp.]